MVNITQHIDDPIRKEVTRLRDHLLCKPGNAFVSKGAVKTSLYFLWTLIRGSSVFVGSLKTRAANQTNQQVKTQYENDLKLISNIARIVKTTCDRIVANTGAIEEVGAGSVILAGVGETDQEIHSAIQTVMGEIGSVTAAVANTCT